MQTTIYLVRHGDVQNPDRILYERMPGFPLSDLGREQAHALGKFLSQKPISAIYASPLARTRETAGIVASYHPKIAVVYDERLLEVSTPARGMKFADLARDHWNWYHRHHIKAGGERLGDIWKRMQKFIREAIRKHQGQEIVAVSHGDPIMISYVKHQGKRLTLSQIRDQEYVDTAKGFVLTFEETRVLDITRLVC